MIMNSYIGRLSTRKPVMYRRMEMMACTHYIARHWYRPKRSKERFVEITIDPIFTYTDNVIVHYSTLSFSTQSITVRPNQRDQTNQPTKAIIDWYYFSHTKTARPIYSCTKSFSPSPPFYRRDFILFTARGKESLEYSASTPNTPMPIVNSWYYHKQSSHPMPSTSHHHWNYQVNPICDRHWLPPWDWV